MNTAKIDLHLHLDGFFKYALGLADSRKTRCSST